MAAAPIELAFDDTRETDRTTVVLLHAFPLDRHVWDPQVDPLRRAGFRVVRADLRGHGDSRPTPEVSTMEAMAADVWRLLERLRVQRFILGGISMGGYVALQMADEHPERILGLLLLDTRAEPDTQEARKKRGETAEMVMREGMGPLAESMVPKFFTAETRRKNTELVETVRRVMLSNPPLGAAQALRGMAVRPDRRPLLSRLNMPALVIVGAADELTPSDSAAVLAEGIPRATLHVIPDVAHLSTLENPSTVNALIVRWANENFETATHQATPSR